MSVLGFFGNSTTTLDTKGRCSFPKELRKLLPAESEGQVMVTVGPEHSLRLYSIPAWNDYLHELKSLPKTRSNIHSLRKFMGGARLSKLDGQHRITLTEEQRAHAGVEGEVTFLGEGEHVSIWTPERYAEICNPTEDQYDNFFYFDDTNEG
ncbi:MAG: hypothetical protein OCD01_07035 [Fibrobacterales bacterium]